MECCWVQNLDRILIDFDLICLYFHIPLMLVTRGNFGHPVVRARMLSAVIFSRVGEYGVQT